MKKRSIFFILFLNVIFLCLPYYNVYSFNKYYSKRGFKLLEYKDLRIWWKPHYFPNGKMDVIISTIAQSTKLYSGDFESEYTFVCANYYSIKYKNEADYFKRRNNGTLYCLYENNIDGATIMIGKNKGFYNIFHRASKYILYYFKIQNEIAYVWFKKYRVYMNWHTYRLVH